MPLPSSSTEPPEMVTDERHPSTIRRPGGHVDRPLAPEQLCEDLNFTSADRHQPKHHLLVGRMPHHLLLIGEKNDPLSIQRRVREPVVIVIERHLLLLAAVRLHAPDLHASR